MLTWLVYGDEKMIFNCKASSILGIIISIENTKCFYVEILTVYLLPVRA